MSGVNNVSQKRTVLVEGIGGLLSFTLLTPIFLSFGAKLSENSDLTFYGTDFHSKLTKAGNEAVSQLSMIGMQFINKDLDVDQEVYRSLAVDIVYIATPPHTHIPLLYGWLKRPNPPKIILVEKPFSENIEEMRELVRFVQETKPTTNIFAFDHADVFALHGAHLESIQEYLGTIVDMTFFWVDDLSGADTAVILPIANQPNARINRFNHLEDEKRQVFDTMSHFFGPLERIIDPKKVQLLQIKAAQYDDCDIKGETFAAVKLLLNDKQSNPITATLYAGRGIGEIQSLGLQKAHMLILSNADGKQVRINSDINTVTFMEVDGRINREYSIPKIYQTELNNMLFGNSEMGHSIDYTLQCLEILDEIRERINQHHSACKFTTYTLGTAEQKAPSLEEVLNQIPCLDSSRDDLLDVSYLEDLGKIKKKSIEQRSRLII